MTRLVAIAYFLCRNIGAGSDACADSSARRLITQVAAACGPGRTRVGGVCVARTTIRHARREVCRCLQWHAGVCAHYE